MVSELSQKINELDAEIKKHNSNLARLDQRRQLEEESYGTSNNCEKFYVTL